MTDAQKLRKLADWFDSVQNNPIKRAVHGWDEFDREVQADLCRIADGLEKHSQDSPCPTTKQR